MGIAHNHQGFARILGYEAFILISFQERIVYYIEIGERLNFVQLTHKGAQFTINLATNSDVWTEYLPTLLALYIDVSEYKIGNSKAELGNLSKLVHSLSTQIKIPQVVLVFANNDLIQLTGDELKKVSPSDQVVDAYEASISELPRKSARNV